MRVALNLLYLLPGEVGGTETYAAGLLDGLHQLRKDCEYVVFLNRRSADWPLPDDVRFRRVVCEVEASSRARRYAFEQSRLPGLLQRAGVDLVHSLGYVSPLITRCPRVVSIHDVHFRADAHATAWGRRKVLEAFVGASARRASAVLTLSNASRGELVSLLGIPAERVFVVPLAGRQLSRRATSAWRPTPNHYFIAFGSLAANKNLARLVEGWQLAGGSPQLVIVGRVPPDVAAQARDAGAILTGYLDDASLIAATQQAQALVFPSLYEGFGLPVLEAMGLGVPVACSNASALPEVGGDAALYFDPMSVRDMADTLRRLAGDSQLRATLAAKGRTRAAQFSWEETARKTHEVYTTVIQQRRSSR